MPRIGRLLTTLALVIAATALTASPALARKRDHDRLPDRWEKRHHLNLAKDDSAGDPDRDGLSNYGEYRAHTNPHRADSDHDGRRDGREDYDRDRLSNATEVRLGLDPGDADSDDDGIKDGRENAGRISAVSEDSVTIALAAGGSVTAALGDELSVHCKGGPDDDAHEGDDDADEGEPSDDLDDEDASGDDDEADEEDEDAGDDEDDHLATAARFGHEHDSCGRSALVVGALVREATVKLTGDGLVLVAVKLVRR